MKIKRINNNKGFSLVELIAAVTIFGFAVVLLLHAFVTSSRLYTKSRNTGEATAAAQNIQESLEAYSVEDIRALDSKFLEMIDVDLTSDSDKVKIDSDGRICLFGAKAGNSEYNARITIDNGRSSGSAIAQINNKDIAKYSKLNMSFNQSIDHDPDEESAEIYKAKKYTGLETPPDNARRRVILIDMVSRQKNPSKDEVTISTTVTFQYHYSSECSKYSNVINGLYDNCPNEVFELDDATIKSYDEVFTIRLLYYPFFENTDVKDTIVIMSDRGSNRSVEKSLKYNVVLVKMNPMVQETVGDKTTWITVKPSDSASKLVPRTDFNGDGFDEKPFNVADQQYQLEVFEVHPRNYADMSYHYKDDGQWDYTVLSNAGNRIYASGEGVEPNDVYLRIMRVVTTTNEAEDFDESAGENFDDEINRIPTKISYLVGGRNAEYMPSLVMLEKDERFFDVTIEIYNKEDKQALVDGSEPGPVYVMHTNKLN